ncbi:hypothetical protein FRB93_008193 [Tulasnella sp. JGI-2019a]|nr:hypothetical protein FRB93_008193 [Tulasnella sp. JGI-2019a]
MKVMRSTPAVLLVQSALVMAQTTINTVFMNDTRLVYSGYGGNPGVGWGDPSLNPATYNNNTCNGGVKSTTVQGASVSLIFTGTAVTVNFLSDHVGSTAQVLIDGNLIQEEDTLNPTSYYYDCNFSPVTSTNLPNQSHNVTIVKDVATSYMYMHSIVFTVSPITSTSSSVSTAGSSSTIPTTTAVVPTSSSNSNTSSGSHSSKGPAIGGAIAATVVLLIAVLAFFLYRRRQQQRQRRIDRRISIGPDGRMHSPDPIVPMRMGGRGSDTWIKDDAASVLPTPNPSHQWPTLTTSASSTEALEMSRFSNRQSSQVDSTPPFAGVARPASEKSQAGRRSMDTGVATTTAAAAVPLSSPLASSSIPAIRPLPPPPGSSVHRPAAASAGDAVSWPQPQSASSTTSQQQVQGGGQAQSLLNPQLEFIQTLVNRGLDSTAISNVINMMAATPGAQAPAGARQESGPDEAPPAYR